MPALYDKLERLWRAELDNRIIGYYDTEALALAALPPTTGICPTDKGFNVYLDGELIGALPTREAAEAHLAFATSPKGQRGLELARKAQAVFGPDAYDIVKMLCDETTEIAALAPSAGDSEVLKRLYKNALATNTDEAWGEYNAAKAYTKLQQANAALGEVEQAPAVEPPKTGIRPAGDEYEVYVEGKLVGTAATREIAAASLTIATTNVTLSDGTPVDYDPDTDGSYPVVISIDWHECSVTTDANAVLSMNIVAGDTYGDNVDIDEMKPAAWAALKRLVLSGVVDELNALAAGKPAPTLDPLSAAYRAGYEAGRDTSEAPLVPIGKPKPPTSPITVTAKDGVVFPGELPYTMLYYRCGLMELCVVEDGTGPDEMPSLSCHEPGERYTPIDLPLSALRDARTLLNSPQVSALLGEAPAVRLERWQSEPDDVDGSICAGWQFVAGEGSEADGKVELFFNDNGEAPSLHALNILGIEFKDVEPALPALNAVLGDPRVRAARERRAAGLPFKAA